MTSVCALERFADESFQLMDIGLDDIRRSFDRVTESFATGVEDDLAATCFKRHDDVAINCGIHAGREAASNDKPCAVDRSESAHGEHQGRRARARGPGS